MTRQGITSYVTLICCLVAIQSSAQTIRAVKKDLWSDPATWDLNRVPLPTDTVLINSFEVTLDISSSVAAIKITNDAGNDISGLRFNSGGSANVLTVNGDVIMVGENVEEEVKFKVEESDSVYIAGDLIMTRTADNDARKRLQLDLQGDSRMTVNGDYYFNYLNAKQNENYDEINIAGNAEFKVNGDAFLEIASGNDFYMGVKNSAKAIFEGDLNIAMTGGNNFLIETWADGALEIKGNCSILNANVAGATSSAGLAVWNPNAKLSIDGDLHLTSNDQDQTASISVSGSNVKMAVGGDINMLATTAGAVGIDVDMGAEVRLGGNLNRLSTEKFGYINMEANCSWIYDGNGAQIVACTEMPQNGVDAFNFSKVAFDNDSGADLILEGPLEVKNELILNKGILVASVTSPLILEQGATVTGGSSDTYVKGPVTKKGQVPSSGFTFPLGSNDTYAPLSISAVTDNNAEYTAMYIGCPPPLGGNIDLASLTNISGTGYWEFERGGTSPATDVRLHWTDASAQGITDPNDLVVARYDTMEGHWESNGNGGYTVGAGSSGSIMNAIGCPPPLGGSRYTLGSSAGNNPLPVVMQAFNAWNKGKIVEINWETADAFDAAYFIIEKASNGINFKPIKTVIAENNRDQITKYFEKDLNPYPGENYYRLCQVDLLGMKVFTEIKLVIVEADNNLSVFPNPVRDVLNVHGDIVPSLYQIEVYDQRGSLIKKTSVIGENGFLQLNTASLLLPNAGIYLLTVKNSERQWSVPFFKA